MLIAWLVCGLGAIFYTYEYLLRIAPSVMEDQLRGHFNLSATGFGFLSASYYYAYVPMQIPVGVLMDRFGPRRLLTFACAICVIGTFMFAGTSLVGLAAFGRFIVGLGSAFAFVGVLKLATIWLPEDRLALMAGLASALGTLGAMIGDNALGAMVDLGGWQQTLNITAIFGIGLLFALWFGIKDHNQDNKSGGTIAHFSENFKDLGIIIRNKQIWINGFYGCLVYLPTTVFAELWGIPYLQHVHGLDASQAHFANSMLFLGFTLGAPTMGFISDYLKRRKLPMQIGAVGAAFIMFLVLYLPGLTHIQLSVLMFVLGIFYSVQAIIFAVGRELSPSEASGTAMAMTNMVVMLGAMLLQPFVGRLLDCSFMLRHHLTLTQLTHLDKVQKMYIASDYRYALTIIPLGILIAAFLTFFLKETYADITTNYDK